MYSLKIYTMRVYTAPIRFFWHFEKQFHNWQKYVTKIFAEKQKYFRKVKKILIFMQKFIGQLL